MAGLSDQSRRAWAIAHRQRGVITYEQLRDLGFSGHAIDHRVDVGRLHRLYRGVYAVGRRDVSRLGQWMAAVLACDPGALLSHSSAAALYGIVRDRPGAIEICVPRKVSHAGIRPHRGVREAWRHRRIPVTSPIDTLIDLASCLAENPWEAAVNEADSLALCTPDELRATAEATRRPGIAQVKRVLDRRTFTLTDSELERLFLPIARRAGLHKPLTRVLVNGWRVDFYWPELGLVVETDGLTYHRTAARQTRDVMRDQAHTVAGLTCLRFTHWQVKYEPDHVEATLAAVARRLAA
jgi:very-short-patch-repair endonuclease